MLFAPVTRLRAFIHNIKCVDKNHHVISSFRQRLPEHTNSPLISLVVQQITGAYCASTCPPALCYRSNRAWSWGKLVSQGIQVYQACCRPTKWSRRLMNSEVMKVEEPRYSLSEVICDVSHLTPTALGNSVGVVERYRSHRTAKDAVVTLWYVSVMLGCSSPYKTPSCQMQVLR